MPTRSSSISKNWIPKISASSRPEVWLALLFALSAPPAAAQGFRVSGRVTHVRGADTVPLAGAAALLHEVQRSGGGQPIDSAVTDRAGAYRFAVRGADTTAVYFVSVSYAGINYVSRPLAGRMRDVASETLMVYDTSGVEPVLGITQRHIIVRAAATDGSRRVLELVVVNNPGTVTRVARDTLHPVWATRLPDGASELEVGESDVGAQTIVRVGDSLALFAPVPPGEKQLIVAYLLGGTQRDLRLTLDQPVARLNVLLEDSLATLEAGNLIAMPPEEMEGVRFVRLEGKDLPGGEVVIRFSSGPFVVGRLWWAVVVAAGMMMFGGLAVWVRRGSPLSVAAAETPDTLAARIAALDAAHEQRLGQAGPEDLESYRKSRDALKTRLVEVLAKGEGKA